MRDACRPATTAGRSENEYLSRLQALVTFCREPRRTLARLDGVRTQKLPAELELIVDFSRTASPARSSTLVARGRIVNVRDTHQQLNEKHVSAYTLLRFCGLGYNLAFI